MTSLFAHTLFFAFRGKRERGAVLAQMFELGNRSLWFVSMSMAFLGAILVFESGMQAAKIQANQWVDAAAGAIAAGTRSGAPSGSIPYSTSTWPAETGAAAPDNDARRTTTRAPAPHLR